MSTFSVKNISSKAVLMFGLLFSSSVLSAQTEIGLQLYTFRNQIPKDVPGMLQKISSMGIRELEGGGTYGLPIDSFKTLLKKNNLKMVSVGAGFRDLDSNIQAVIDKAKIFDASFVTCTWIPHEKEFTIEHAKKAVDVFNKAGKTLKENGISLVYHPHGYEFGSHEGK